MTTAEAHRVERIVGRDAELAVLENVTAAALPSVTFVSGIGGIGKSRLLDAFALRRRAGGATAIRIDCRNVEPTVPGFFRELSHAVGGHIASCDDASVRLGSLGNVVVILDDVDALRLLDAWLRLSFVVAMPPNVHFIFSGRNPPLSAWLQMPWRGTFRTLELAALADADAVALLKRSGIEAVKAERVNRIARGHPLALALASTTLQNVDDPALEELAFYRIVDELARWHLAEIEDPVTRRAVEAASVLRRVTAPLLGAMMPDVAPSDAYERLRALPLMQLSRDGLLLHDTVRDAIAAELHSSDPNRYLALRRACWNHLTRELRTAPHSELWRYTADLLYLLENPVVREAFFPSGTQQYAVESARPSDEPAILAITAQHDGSEAASETAVWWRHRSEDFYVARDRDGIVAGYYVLFSSLDDGITFPHDDPVLTQWNAHLTSNPVNAGERVFFLRRWLSRADGEAPSPIQAACWLDVKRAYMAHRPHLRRVYLAVRNAEPHAAAAAQLGFSVLDDGTALAAGQAFVTAMLDFGPDSVDGWIARLVAAELGIATSRLLDCSARELVVGARRSPLTRREFDTLYLLIQRAGSVVNRDEILDNVWGSEADVGSNVVDVTIRSLRKKLADRAHLIETISGFGYRFRGDEGGE